MKLKKVCTVLLMFSILMTYLPAYAVASDDSIAAEAASLQKEIYVSVAEGSDESGDGSFEKPYKSIQKAADMATAGTTCYIREGTYYEEVVVKNSGTLELPITFKNYNDEKVYLSGADIVGGFKQYKDNIYVTKEMNWDLFDTNDKYSGNQIFIDNEIVEEARWPNLDADDTLLDPTWANLDNSDTSTWLVDKELPKLDNTYVGGKVFVRGSYDWYGQFGDITGYSEEEKKLDIGNYTGANSHFYHMMPNDRYYIYGCLGVLDANGEWFYDSKTKELYLCSDVDPNKLQISSKRRNYAFKVDNTEHINIEGLSIRAGAISMKNSTNINMNKLDIRYLRHPIIMDGDNCSITNSYLYYSWISHLFVQGRGNVVYNNLIEYGNFAGSAQQMICMNGSFDAYIGYNTMRDSGRDVLDPGAQNSIIEYNDISRSGWITSDCGVVYGGFEDGSGTEFRYNWVHDNMAGRSGFGFYLDNSTTNFTVHHNVVWSDVTDEFNCLTLNLPSLNNIFYNNTFIGTSNVGVGEPTVIFDNRLVNNIFKYTTNKLYKENIQYNNMYGTIDPKIKDIANRDFSLDESSPAINAGIPIEGITEKFIGDAPDLGAYEYGGEYWIPGHNFENPPKIKDRTLHDNIDYKNKIAYGDFENINEDLNNTSWELTGEKNVVPTWGWDGSVHETPRYSGKYGVQVGNSPVKSADEKTVSDMGKVLDLYDKKLNAMNFPQGFNDIIWQKGTAAISEIYKQTTNLSISSGFEEEGAEWCGLTESCKQEVVSDTAHTGEKSVKVSELVAGWAGLRLYTLEPNKRYSVSFYAMSKEDSDVRCIMHAKNGYDMVAERQVSFEHLNANEWTKVNFTFETYEQAETFGLCIGTAQALDFYIDDIFILDMSFFDRVYDITSEVVPSLIKNLNSIKNNPTIEDLSESTLFVLNEIYSSDRDKAIEVVADLVRMSYEEVVSLESGLTQQINNLKSNTKYKFITRGRLLNDEDEFVFSVSNYGGDTVQSTVKGFKWSNEELCFTTGSENTTAVVSVTKPLGKDCGYLDCLVVIPVDETLRPQPSAAKSVPNGDFESASNWPWYNFHGKVTVKNENGNYYLNTSENNGPHAQTMALISNIGNEKKFSFTARAKLEDAEKTSDIVKMELAVLVGLDIHNVPLDEANITNDGWIELKGEQHFSFNKNISSASIVFKTVGNSSYAIDDVNVSQIMLPTQPGSGDDDPSIEKAIANKKKWIASGGEQMIVFGQDDITVRNGNLRYAGDTYRDFMMKFNMKVEDYQPGDYPIITIRNQGEESYASGYTIVIKESMIELQKYAGVTQEMLFIGSKDDPNGTYGPAFDNETFKMGVENLIEVGSFNESNGVRIILKINGVEVINFVDELNPIEQHGFLSFYTGGVEQIVISPEK